MWIFSLIITDFDKLRLHYIIKKILRNMLDPLAESTSLQGYLRAWYVIFDVKKKKPPFCTFWSFGGRGGVDLLP